MIPISSLSLVFSPILKSKIQKLYEFGQNLR